MVNTIEVEVSRAPTNNPLSNLPVLGIYAYMHPGMPMMGSGNGPATTEWEDYWGQGRP